MCTSVGHLEYEYLEFLKTLGKKVKTGKMVDLWDEIRGLGISECSPVSDEKAKEIRSKYAKVM